MGLKPAGVPYLFPEGSRFGADNLVLHARARRHSVQGFPGPLSIKTVVRGEVTWILRERRVTVHPPCFLLLREGEEYSLDIDSRSPVETCCVFFQDGFAEQVFHDATTPLSASLDDPLRTSPQLPFLSHLHPDADGRLLPHVQSLARRCKEELAPSAAEQEFLAIAARLLLFHEDIRMLMARLPAAKASTREELFRRLLTARDYIHGHLDGPLSLDVVARAACLSRYHFHHAFTDAFQQTPHACITDLRLARAHSLLEGEMAVGEACTAVGFSSSTSFSRLFRARYGKTPSAIRKIGSASPSRSTLE